MNSKLLRDFLTAQSDDIIYYDEIEWTAIDQHDYYQKHWNMNRMIQSRTN